MKDFFTRFSESRKHPIIVPAIFGILFSIAIVSHYHDVPLDPGAIQANVIEANTPKVTYDADILGEKDENVLNLRIGKDAQDVESLSVTLLGDPQVFVGLIGDISPIKITNNEPGVYLIQVDIGRSMKAGEIIATLYPRLEGKTTLTLIDAGFRSGGSYYSLTTKMID